MLCFENFSSQREQEIEEWWQTERQIGLQPRDGQNGYCFVMNLLTKQITLNPLSRNGYIDLAIKVPQARTFKYNVRMHFVGIVIQTMERSFDEFNIFTTFSIFA